MIKFVEFEKTLNSNQEYSVYLFEGEDGYFRSLGLSLLKDKFLSEPNLNLATFEGKEDISGIESSLFSLPFLSNKRFTVVKEFYPDAKTLKGGIGNFINNPSPDAVFIIINEKPCEALKKLKTVLAVDCKKADALTIAKWIKSRCLKEGIEIDGETATTIAKYSLLDMKRVENEVEKLLAYKGYKGKITLSDVEENVYKDSEHKIFNLTDFVGKKQFDNALGTINDMLGKNEPSHKILISITNHFRRLLFTAVSGKTNEELVSLLGISEYTVIKMREQIKYFKTRAIKNAVDYLQDADYKIKSGKMEATIQMWLSVFKIMTE